MGGNAKQHAEKQTLAASIASLNFASNLQSCSYIPDMSTMFNVPQKVISQSISQSINQSIKMYIFIAPLQ